MNLDLEITKTAKVFHGPGKLACHKEAEVYELDLVLIKSTMLP
jgi:hypothetical protein